MKTIANLVMCACLAMATGGAYADAIQQNDVTITRDVATKLLGDPAAPEQAQRTVVITAATRYVNVTEGDVVKFVTNGTTFAWNFDTPPGVTSFELNRVAPAGAIDHRVTVYVARNMDLYD